MNVYKNDVQLRGRSQMDERLELEKSRSALREKRGRDLCNSSELKTLKNTRGDHATLI